MFEKFSKESRAAVVAAQTVAREAGSASIDTRHVLVALASTPGPAADALRRSGLDPADVAEALRADLRSGGIDAEALAALGVDLEAVRRETDAVFGAGALDRAGRKARKGHIPFTPDAKKALELALREAVRLQDKTIDGRHVLLGILRADCTGGRALERALHDAGYDVATLRTAVEEQHRAV
ncbi:Clp protease N-terminal domain-containing protein [Isoptericola croceus]|uniref:Clp protease N-terminal domain-containing protein n=1 Tax=Isoptericola croceus TaxID=3031406 RepID=UPI0023F8E9CB|nr:Clp protease N-terminal domain-containing protein [Isoptericola croceus]